MQDKLIRMADAARLIDRDYAKLQEYKREGRWVKQHMVNGVPHYLTSEVMAWNPKDYPTKKKLGKLK